MCDSEIHPGLIEDWSLSRRTFVAGGVAAAGLASAARGRMSVTEKDVTIKTPDGMADAAYFAPGESGLYPAVLIWPDILGLRPVFRDMGKRLASEGYTVLVPNPFYRSKKAPIVEGAFDFSNREAMNQIMGYRQAITDEGMDKDAIAFMNYLDSRPRTAVSRKAGVQGYCMGGPFAFRTAVAVPGRIGAVGSFHGAGLVSDAPDSPHLLIPKTRANFLVCIAQNDDARQPDAKDKLKAAFAAAQRPATVEVYPGDHGWCVPGSQVYNQAAAEKAWSALLALYKTSLV